MTVNRPATYYSLVRSANVQIWQGLQALISLQEEWNANNYAVTLPAGSGDNVPLVAADLGAVVFDAADLLQAVLDAGVATSMAKLL